MGRAFTKESDGGFCSRRMKECIYADEDGRCIFTHCAEDEQSESLSKTDAKHQD